MLFEKLFIVICMLLILSKETVTQNKGRQASNVQTNETSFLNAENNNNGKIIFPDDDSNMSVSERKCLEYTKNSFEVIEARPLTQNSKPTKVVVRKCRFDVLLFILGGGGTDALPGELPFMAALGYNGSDDGIQWYCGGTLISDYYVMTAAHCIITRFGPPVVVRLGELDLSSTDDNSFPEDFGIVESTVHPQYKAVTKHNDIALIKLNKQVKFNNFIRPACLWNNYNIEHQSAIVAGWGAKEAWGQGSDILQKIHLFILNQSICDRTFSSNKYFKNGIPNTMLCAGDLRGGRDTCGGDSGGPLTVTKKDNNCIFYAIGITSFGKVCLLPIPSIYTRVSEYIPWIEKIVWE